MTPLWIREADVAALLDMRSAIAAVEQALAAEAAGTAHDMAKTHVKWGASSTLHALGAVLPEEAMAGAKTWAHTEHGATPLLILFDAPSGVLRAVIEAFALGQLRTGAVSGVATRHLAADDAAELAIIGTGRQALAQIAAAAAVRRLRAVRVFSPTAAHRDALAARVRVVFGIDATAVESVAKAVAGAPIVTLVSRAREPLLSAAMLAPGTHVNAIGAITLERAELAADVLGRCAIVAADSVAAVQRLSREFRDHFGDSGNWSAVVPLHRVAAGAVRRERDTDVTLFKAMGIGLADVALGGAVLARARNAGRGVPLAHPQPVEIDWARSSVDLE